MLRWMVIVVVSFAILYCCSSDWTWFMHSLHPTPEGRNFVDARRMDAASVSVPELRDRLSAVWNQVAFVGMITLTDRTDRQSHFNQTMDHMRLPKDRIYVHKANRHKVAGFLGHFNSIRIIFQRALKEIQRSGRCQRHLGITDGCFALVLEDDVEFQNYMEYPSVVDLLSRAVDVMKHAEKYNIDSLALGGIYLWRHEELTPHVWSGVPLLTHAVFYTDRVMEDILQVYPIEHEYALMFDNPFIANFRTALLNPDIAFQSGRYSSDNSWAAGGGSNYLTQLFYQRLLTQKYTNRLLASPIQLFVKYLWNRIMGITLTTKYEVFNHPILKTITALKASRDYLCSRNVSGNFEDDLNCLEIAKRLSWNTSFTQMDGWEDNVHVQPFQM